MRTRSSSNLVGESSPNPTSLNPKLCNRRRSEKPFILEESPVDTMVDQRTLVELLRAPTEGYAEAIVVPSILTEHFELKHSLINMMTSDQFFGLEKDNPYDHILNQQTSVVTTAITAILKKFQATLPPAFVKSVKEDNIQGYVSAIAVNYNQGNFGYRPPCVANQIRPSGFAQPNVQNNQNWFSQPQGYNRGNDFNQDSSYQALIQQNQLVPLSELKAITTRSGLVLDGTFVPIPPPFINPEEDERVEETLTDPDFAEYNIKVPPPLVQKAKPPSQRNYVQDKDEIQIHKFWQMFKQLHINITFADALILNLKYQKMLKALLSDKEKLLELRNTPLNENCSAVILKKLPEKLRDPRKFLILCSFSELKCKALTDLGASINLMPLSVWKEFGLPELISIRMTLELANWAICTPDGIERDVFVPVGKFTFPADFVIVDYESDPRVLFILGRPFLQTARALIDIHGEEMILCDGDEILTLNMRHDTSSYPNQSQQESINMINIYNDSYEDYLEDLFATNHLSGNPTFSSSPEVINPLSGNPTSSSPDHFLEEFADELALITFPPGNDDLPFDIESDLREIEYLLNHDTTKEMDSILKDSVDECNLANPNVVLFDTIPEMFTDEHTLDYSSTPLYDDIDDELVEFESSDFLPSLEYDSFFFEDFSEVDALPQPIMRTKYLIRDFNPPLYELPFHKEVPGSETLLSFSPENEEKVFKPGILTSKGVHTSLLPELSHRGPKAFKVIKIFKSPIEIFPCSYEEDICILDVPCSISIPHEQLNLEVGSS
nr:hypothetical protein [Tanacetum cinerariifolium]